MIREISQIWKSLNFKNRLYKSANWINSSVSSMTSAEEGQPPSNEPEEWKHTHPLSTLRWGITLLTKVWIKPKFPNESNFKSCFVKWIFDCIQTPPSYVIGLVFPEKLHYY